MKRKTPLDPRVWFFVVLFLVVVALAIVLAFRVDTLNARVQALSVPLGSVWAPQSAVGSSDYTVWSVEADASSTKRDPICGDRKIASVTLETTGRLFVRCDEYSGTPEVMKEKGGTQP